MKKARKSTRSDDSDFMYAMVVTAESWPLLIGLPVLAGIISFSIVALTPTQYRAASTIPLIEGATAKIDSAEFARRFEASGLSVDDFKLGASFDSATWSTTITTTTTDAEHAREAVEETIATLRIMAPIPTSRLAKQAELLSAQIDRLEDFTASVETSLQSSTSVSAPGVTDAVVALTDAIRTKQETLGTIQDQLEAAEKIAALPPEVVVTPIAKDWRGALAAILAAATLGAALVYGRLRLLEASKVPGFDEKRARIVRALTFNLLGRRTDNGSQS